jgi:hypothetical protein
LALDNRPPDRMLIGVERWPSLTTVECYGVPHPAEVAALAELPNLTRLVINQPEARVELVGLPDRVVVDLVR